LISQPIAPVNTGIDATCSQSLPLTPREVWSNPMVVEATPVQARRYLVLGICCMSLFIVGLDATIVNVALPTIRHDLHASVSELQWVIDAYTVVIASLLMLSGSTADRLGRARIFQLGLLLFTAGSLLCSVAGTIETLIAFRAVQAIGGSMLNPVAMSIIRNVFTDPRERAQAIGIWGGVVGLSMALGPVLGGGLVEGIGWRSVFWVNVPVGLAAIVLTRLYVPESRAERARRLDPVGQALVLTFLATLTYAIIETPAVGVISAVALIALVVYEPRRRDPLIELRFFRSVPFAGATLVAVGAFVAFGGFLFLTTLYLQGARHLSPFTTGLYLLPMAALVAVIAPLSGRVTGRFGARASLCFGGVALAVAGLLLTDLDAHTSVAHLFVAYALFGAGFGGINPPITNAAVSGMPPEQAGVAAAIASTSRQIGVSLGVAVLGGVAAATGWWIIVGCGAAVFALGVVTTGAWARRTAAVFADEL
jgi:EmrB/QacA subfamily drug resistance transporter